MSSPRIASNRLLQQLRRRTALLIALGGWKTQIFTDSCNLTLTPTFHPNFTVMRQQERLQERRWWRPICAQWPESARWFAATPHAVQAPHKKKLSKGAQVNERISKAQSPKEIGEIITSLPTQGQQLTAVHVSTALSRLCSLNKKTSSGVRAKPTKGEDASLLVLLETHLAQGMDSYPARALASAINSAAKLGCCSDAIVKALDQRCTQQGLHDFNAQDLANTASVAEKAQEMVGVFSPAQLQALARAAAQAGQPLPSLVDAIGRAAVRSLGRFRVQELANLLYGIAASGNTHPGLFSAAAATLPGKLEAGDRSVKGQDIALTAWAFAKSQPLATAAFEALGRAAVREFKALNHTDKSMLLYAFAEAGRYQEAARLSALVADSAATDRHGCVAGWSLQSLALTAHALAKMGVPSEELFRAIASEAVPRLREARASHLQVLVWSHAAQRYAAPGLFNAVAKEIRPRLGEMSGQGLALTAWAYSTLAPHSQVTLALLEEVFRVVEGMLHPSSSAQDGAALAPEDMSRLAWSMAAAGDGSLLNRSRLWSLCRPWQSAGASLGCMDLISMFQAELSVIRGELRHASSDVAAQGSSVDPIPALRDPLRSLARQRWEEQAISTRSSRFQAEVAKALRLAGFQCREEVLTSDGLFSVDIMIEVSGIQIAVEADGPSHFTCSIPFEATGSTELRWRLLRDRVPALISVRFWEWDQLQGHPARQVAFMKGLVKQAVESCSCDASKSSGQDQSSTREGLNAKHNDI